MKEYLFGVTKRFQFHAAHSLYNPKFSEEWNIRTYGKCLNLHGHGFLLEVTVEGEVNKDTGMVMNFNDVKSIVDKYVISKLDHSFIATDGIFKVRYEKGIFIVTEKVADFGLMPTCENLIQWIRDKLLPHLKELKHLKLFETSDNCAELEVE